MKIKKIDNAGPQDYKYVFDCPGCGYSHGINSGGQFNQDFERPTISPSINHFANSGGVITHRCHSFVKDGNIQFLSDCTHELKGKTVELPDID